jgi:MFS family permease
VLGANTAGRLIGRWGGRTLACLGLIGAAIGLVISVMWSGTMSMIVGLSVAAAGIGSLFLVASVTVLSQVEPRKSGVASGIVSTFHEFGASLGTAVVSSVAATSLTTGAGDGFDRAFGLAAAVAAVAAVIATLLIPPRASATVR